MKKKIFTRVISGAKITITVEPCSDTPADYINGEETKKTLPYNVDGVLCKVFGFYYTYAQKTWEDSLERQRLFAKKMDCEKNNLPFPKKDATLLLQITKRQGRYAGCHYDGLYNDYVNALYVAKELDEIKHKPILTEAEKAKRLKDAKELLVKLLEKRRMKTQQTNENQ